DIGYIRGGEFLVQAKQEGKVYDGMASYRALKDINLDIEKLEFVGVMSLPGRGKTTLLNLIAAIDETTTGTVLIEGNNPYQLNRNDLAKFRRRSLGFVFQDFNLLHTLTVKENIVLPLTLDGKRVKEMEEKAEAIAKTLGISSIMNKRTYEISGGQAQRAAIARAMIHKPKLLLADEPTGNLDSKSSKDVMEMLATLNQQEQATMLLVTHDPQAASFCDRIIFIRDGQFYSEIHQGENRKAFFQKIIDTLSLLGGDDHDFSSVRD